MEKNEINFDNYIKVIEEIYNEALLASSYFLIVQKLRKSFKEYNSEVNISPAFYSYTLSALQEACFVNVAKLYDNSKNSKGLNKIIRDVLNNERLFSRFEEDKVCHEHFIKKYEECFFEEHIQKEKEFNEIFDNSEDVPISIKLTSKQYLELYKMVYNSFSKTIEKVRTQRNKIYVHNDERGLIDLDSIQNNFPISYQEMEKLIEFALDVTTFILSVLTGDTKARKVSNINDLENTLMMVAKGLEIQKEKGLI